jgi:uncharacterized membrane protein YccC
MTTASTPHTGVAEPRGSRLVLSDKAKYSIKLGLAIAITYGLALRANWMSPTWAAIAVAMIGQPGHGQSLYKGMLRAIGTLIAFFCGLFILMLFPQDRWLTLVVTSPFLGYFTYRMKGQNSYLWFVAAFVTPMIVMAGPAQPGHAFEFAAYRTLETLMGIGVWALVSIFLWPATNRGALQTAMDELLATQQKILTALRESATDGDSAGVPFALQEQEAQLVKQVGSLIDVVAAETYEVRGVRGAWHRLHAASQSFLHVSSRIQSGMSNVERIPLSSVLPAVPDFLAELEARLTEARSLLGGAPQARPCQDVALEVDADAFGALGHFARAGAVAARAELAALDAHTRTIVECAQEIREDKRAASTPSADTTPAKVRGPLALLPLDRDQLMGAIIAVATMWGGTLIWIYVNPPGHVSWFQFPTNLVLVALLNPQMRFFPLRMLGYAYLAAMLVYVFIMPHLTGFVQLGSLLFAFTFITAYFFPKAATFLLLAMFNMFGISNEQTYDFASMMNAYVFTMSGILMVYGMTYLIGSPRPEKTMLRQVRRFFRSCEFLVAHTARSDSWVDRVKQAYHQRELQTLPAKIATWSAQIDQKRFPQNSAEQVKALAVRLQLLAFRIDDVLNLRSDPQAELLVRQLGEEVGSWRELLEEAFHAWSGAEEADPGQNVHERLSGRLAQLSARVEEEVSRIQANKTGDAAGEGFYRVLGAFRGVTNAGIAYDERSREIDWEAWREEQFA